MFAFQELLGRSAPCPLTNGTNVNQLNLEHKNRNFSRKWQTQQTKYQIECRAPTSVREHTDSHNRTLIRNCGPDDWCKQHSSSEAQSCVGSLQKTCRADRSRRIRNLRTRCGCPTDNPSGGRTPAGYFWDPARIGGMALGQTKRTDRMGAYVKIVATSASCSGYTLVTNFNDGTQTSQENASSCMPQARSGSIGGSGSGGYMGPNGQMYYDRKGTPPCESCRNLGPTEGGESGGTSDGGLGVERPLSPSKGYRCSFRQKSGQAHRARQPG